MKKVMLPVLLAVISAAPYAFAQVSCPCDDAKLPNGNSGDEIVDILCPGGTLAEGNVSVVDPDEVLIRRPGGDESLELTYTVFIDNGFNVCAIFEESVGVQDIELTDEEYIDCRRRLILGCNLNGLGNGPIGNIPTLSEWGMMAMAAVLGVCGLIVVARRRKAAA